jgi:glycosyltransferase involved in cell wall biosynthesis
MTEGPVVYVVAQFPKVSQTFVLGEIRELVRQGTDVRVMVLRPPTAADRALVDCRDLDGRVTTAPGGWRGTTLVAWSAISTCVLAPSRALPELARVLRWTVQHRALHELVRFGQAAYLRTRLPPATRHLHAHFAHGPASVAMTVSRLTSVPFSFTAHARDLFNDTALPVLREKAAAAAFVVTISEHGRRFVESLDVPDTRVILVRNGIDLQLFRARSADPPFRVATVCRLVEKKGVDVLVDALTLLRARGVDMAADIVGDGPLRSALQERARDAGVADLLTWHGPATPDQVRQALAGAGCFVLPCRVDSTGDADGLPVSIIEAMACGLPVISTATAGIPEAVVDGECGLLVPPDDPARLAGALARLQADEALRRRLAEGASKTAAGFDRARWVAVLRQAFCSQTVSAPSDLRRSA